MSGGGTGTSKDQLDKQNQLQQQAFQAQQAQLATINAAVGKYLPGNVGYDPAMLATLKSQFLNQNATSYNQAAQNVMTALARRGSIQPGQPVGGDYTRGIASLEGAEASNRASGMANIDLSNSQQALTNQFNAASLMSGNAATLNSPISTFGSGANNALNQYVYASNQGFGSTLMRSFGSALGNTLGGGNLNIGLTGKLPCWIARAVYGDHDPRWMLVRDKFAREAETSFKKRVLLGLYIIAGEPLAELVKRSRPLRSAFRSTFDRYIEVR